MKSLKSTGGSSAELWRNLKSCIIWVEWYVQPMFSRVKLTVGINRSEGEERKRTPLLASSAEFLFSKGVKIGGTSKTHVSIALADDS